MKMMQLFPAVAALLLLTTISAQAEYRIWTDTDGSNIEAEYVQMSGSSALLKLRDGEQLRVPLQNLSTADIEYIQLQTPPRIDADVTTSTDRSNTGFGGGPRGGGGQVQKEQVQCTAKLRKSSSAPYPAKLDAELYVIGIEENRDAYIVLDRTFSSFTFQSENENKHEFSSRMISLRQLETGSSFGVDYEGYLLVVTDMNDNVVEVKGSRSVFEENLDKIREFGRGAVFDEDFNLRKGSASAKKNNQKVAEKTKQKKGSPRRRIPGRKY